MKRHIPTGLAHHRAPQSWEGLEDDRRYTRVRLRHTVLPLLERELGPGVAATLARTADQARADVEFLDALATAPDGADAQECLVTRVHGQPDRNFTHHSPSPPLLDHGRILNKK